MSNPARFDTHVHTRFSPDGRSSMGDYARRVDAGEADGIGFSEHYEFWPASDACGFLDERAYLAEVAGWRDRGYRFFAGVEVDFMEPYEGAIRDHLGRFAFDFVIGSVHNLPSVSVSGRDTSAFEDDGAFDRVLTEYGRAFTASLVLEEFDVLGHPGVFLRHFGPEFFVGRPWAGRLRDLEDDLARKVARSDKLLEVNTSGLFSARKAPCAGPFFLERYRAHGGRTVTLASDAHEAAHLRRGFPEAAALLGSLGFDRVYLPWDRENPVPLEDYAR